MYLHQVVDWGMARLTIKLLKQRQQVLKQAAADLVAKARKRAGLNDNDAMQVGIEATRAVRRNQD